MAIQCYWGSLVLSACFLTVVRSCNTSATPELIYEWVALDYDWPSDSIRDDYLAQGKFIKQNNVINGIRVFDGEVYVTSPRFRHGIPSTLNRVVQVGETPVLQPFPSWRWQELGNCSALQFVPAVEVDPNTGWMWMIDTGRVNTFTLDNSPPENLCPAKLVIYDLRNDQLVRSYTFPETVASATTNFLNDIVIGYVDGRARYAYISDSSAVNPGLVVYDYDNNTSHRFFDAPSMSPKEGEGDITINNITTPLAVPINGIAMSPDSKFVYFSAISAYSLYQVPTAVLNDPLGDIGAAVHEVGTKVSQSDGMVYGQRNLYFGTLSLNGVYKWEISKDAETMQTYSEVDMRTQTCVVNDNEGMQWVDTLTIDVDGYLWFVSNKLYRYFGGTLDVSDYAVSSNFRIWRVNVGEKGYLDHSATNTSSLA